MVRAWTIGLLVGPVHWTGSMILLDGPGPVQHAGPTVWTNSPNGPRPNNRSGLAVKKNGLHHSNAMFSGLLTLTLTLDSWLKPIHSIPAMSAELERVFSGTKHTISDQRNSLKTETIELLKCLKSWFRLNIFTEEDLYAIISNLTENKDIETLEPMD